MKYKHLGRSGAQVSRLALGTMNFGMVTEEPEAFAIMDAAQEAGINHFDTADVYGGPMKADIEKGFGISEEIVGRWMKQGNHRDEVFLATKLYQPMGYGINDRKLSAIHIRKAAEASLRRLQTDHIDLYQMHHIDRATPWEEIWQAMERLHNEGKVTYFGSSNFAGWDLATAQSIAENRNFMGLVSEQSVYNLSARAIELEVIPAAGHFGIGIIPWSPLAAGMLGGALQKAKDGRRSSPDVQRKIKQLLPQLKAYEALCGQIGEGPADVAVAWLLHNPAVTNTIVGPRTVEQLTGSLRAVEITLSEDTLQNLDEIWPGPGGEAPEAYAW